MHLVLVWGCLCMNDCMRHGMEAISLWRCWGVVEALVSLIEAFSSSELLGLVHLIFLLTQILYEVQVR